MKRVTVSFMHPLAKTIEGVRNLLKVDERKFGFEFQIDNESPDYVFASEHIYYNSAEFDKFIKLYKGNPVTIFLGGEAIAGDLNLFDYTISFDKYNHCEDRTGRIPLLSFFALDEDILNSKSIEVKSNKTGFCNFIYSNANAHPRRDELFYLINKYKKVDSLGRHLNNKSCESDRYSADWRKESIIIKSDYKFSISAENACYRGYTSEKIMTSFLAGSIPIYWGNPLVEEEFNPNAFINANKYDDEELLELIKDVDTNNDLYHEIISQPWMTENQIERYYIEKEEYEHFINNIFSQSKIDAYRRGVGTAPGYYYDFVIRRKEKNTQKGSFLKRLWG